MDLPPTLQLDDVLAELGSPWRPYFSNGWALVSAWTAYTCIIVLAPRRLHAHQRVVESAFLYDRGAASGWLHHAILRLDYSRLVPEEHGVVLCLERGHVNGGVTLSFRFRSLDWDLSLLG